MSVSVVKLLSFLVGSLSKTAVQETPAHKQVSHALWSKQDRARLDFMQKTRALCMTEQNTIVSHAGVSRLTFYMAWMHNFCLMSRKR